MLHNELETFDRFARAIGGYLRRESTGCRKPAPSIRLLRCRRTDRGRALRYRVGYPVGGDAARGGRRGTWRSAGPSRCCWRALCNRPSAGR